MKPIPIEIPFDVKELIGELEHAGYTAYIVGGSVRDAVMGKVPHDYDICTSASPEQMKTVFAGRNVIETGLKHGTLTVVGRDGHYEITTYRIDGNYGDNRHPEDVKFVDNIEEDLARRDFTVNAMAYGEKAGMIDPFGGISDVKNRIIRCVGDPNKRFTEDALRILRGVRFSSVCGFQVEEDTEKAMFFHKHLLEHVSAERKNVEFCKLLVPADIRILMQYKEIFATFIPELVPMFGFDQRNFHHRYDVYEHTAQAVVCAPQDLIIRLALFFHDIGKPSVFSIDENGVGHFYDHAKVGKERTETILKRLKFDNATIRAVSELVEAHGVVPSDSLKYARKLLHRHGEEQVRRLVVVARCDLLAQAAYQGRDEKLKLLDILQKNLETVIAEKQCVSVKDLAVNGNDIMSLGVKEGKKIGELLQFLLETVMESPEKNEKDQLLSLVRARL